MRLVALHHHELGVRVYVLGRRWHHGLTGVLAVLAGLVACAHDRRDWRDWLPRREVRPPL